MNNENLFQCAVCLQTYTMGRPDKEARDELVRDFPNVNWANVRPVCGDCYDKLKAREAAWKKKNNKSDA